MEQVPHGEVEGVQRGALAMNVVGHGDALAWHAERQALGMVQNLLQLAKLDWPVLDCSTVCRRQKTLQVELSSLRTKSPLQLLVDITGIKFPGEGEWKRKKHGAEYRRSLVETKMHCFKRLGERAHLRAPGGGAACPPGLAQSLQPNRAPSNRAGSCRGIGPPGTWAMPPAIRFVPQSQRHGHLKE